MEYTKTKSVPWEAANPEVEWFDHVNRVTLDYARVTVVEFDLPIGSYGLIKWFGQHLSNPQMFDDVTWRILVNDAPIRHYGNLNFQISSIESPTEVFIYLQRKANVKLVAEGQTVVNVTGRLKGYFWLDILNNGS